MPEKKYVNIVVPMGRRLPDPILIQFPFRVKNTFTATINPSVGFSAPSGWHGFASTSCGDIAVGAEKDILIDRFVMRDKPATDTTETVTMTVVYYSGGKYVSHDYIYYTFTFIDFDSGTYSLVDEDTFEADLEGWTKTDESGATTQVRSNAQHEPATGAWSMRHHGIDTGDIAYLSKSFAIGAVSKAYIRVPVSGIFDFGDTDQILLELITDAGAVTQKRTLSLPITGKPLGRLPVSDFSKHWAYFAVELPVNNTYEVRLRVTCVSGTGLELFYDDIKVITKA